MIVKPTVGELLTKAQNRYELVIATARRARQISEERRNRIANSGEKQKNDTKQESDVTLAAIEIAEGKVKIC